MLSASMVSLLSHLLYLQIVHPHPGPGQGGWEELEKERKYWHPLSPDSEMSPSLTRLQYCEMKWEVRPVSQLSFPHVQLLLERLCQWQQPGDAAHGTQALHRALSKQCERATSLPASGKSVKWKLGADNDVWVWVMGEHPSDKSYAAICEEIQAQRAKQLASEQGKEAR